MCLGRSLVVSSFTSVNTNSQTKYLLLANIENLPAQSVVKAMSTVDDSFYLGGTFSGTSKSNGTYVNFVQYDTTTIQLKSVPSNGFDGSVNAIACTTTGNLTI